MTTFTNPTIAILKQACEILRDEKRFIRGAWAGKDRKGQRAGQYDTINRSSNFEAACDTEASCWCAEGAIYKAACDLGYGESKAHEAINAADDTVTERKLLGRSLGWSGIQGVNDKLGHKKTMEALTIAIHDLTKKLRKEKTSA